MSGNEHEKLTRNVPSIGTQMQIIVYLNAVGKPHLCLEQELQIKVVFQGHGSAELPWAEGMTVKSVFSVTLGYRQTWRYC